MYLISCFVLRGEVVIEGVLMLTFFWVDRTVNAHIANMASQEELFSCIGEDVDVGDFLDEALEYEGFQSPEEMERNRRTHQSELEFATESLRHPMMALGGGLLNQADGLRFFEKLLPPGYMVRLPRDMYGDC